jgi:N-methylhydantoinase A
VVVPFGAGVGSAIGLLRAQPKIDVSVTRVMPVDPGSEAAIHRIYAALERRAADDLARLGLGGTPVWSRYGYLRYRGQGYEIRADLPGGAIAGGFPAAVCEAFHRAYEASYGYRDPAAAIEAVDWHLVATVPVEAAGLDLGWRAPAAGAPTPTERRAWFPETDGFVATSIHLRGTLAAGVRLDGPAIIEDPEATIVVPPGMHASVSPQGHIVIATGAEA